MAKFEGYRTLALSVLMIVAGQLQTNVEFMSSSWAGTAMTVLGLLTAVLRFQTKGPVGTKPE